MDRKRLLSKLDVAWTELRQSYEGLSDAELTKPSLPGDWSVRDTLAHITSWEEEALKHLPGILTGARPPRYSVTYGGIDSFNARMTQEARALSLAVLLQRFDETHRRLVAFVESTADEQIALERFRRRLRLDTYSHYSLHAKAIWTLRESPRGSREVKVT
jgi:uncharacterized protein (TIGR03083 family)